MKKYTFLILTILISAATFAQKQMNKLAISPPKTRFFVDGKEADILVAKLIDPKNYASIGLDGVSPSDITNDKMSKTPTGLRMVTKPGSKFMSLTQFFEQYKVPVPNQKTIKINGDLLTIRKNFLASESRVANVELKDDAIGAFVNIIIK